MKDEVRVTYLRDKKKFPVACVASKPVDKNVVFSLATWNPLDKFEKKTGRDMAAERLEKGEYSGTFPVNDSKLIRLRLLAEISHAKVPGRARKAATKMAKALAKELANKVLGEFNGAGQQPRT